MSYFLKRKFLRKGDQHFLGLTIAYHHAMPFQKIFHRADHENKIAPTLKREFFKELTNMTNV